MFRMSLGSRTARGLAAAALIFSLTATTFAGSAYAAPLAENDCSAAAHSRNDAVHLLHTAWKAFNRDLKELAGEARKLQHESREDRVRDVVTKDARAAVASATKELRGIVSKAHADIEAAAELGSTCNEDEDNDKTTTPPTTGIATTSTNTTVLTNVTAPADSTGSTHTFATSGLDAKFKDIVATAIADMQVVVDDARKAVLDMTTVVESKTNDDEDKDESKVEKAIDAAKADREKAKEAREKVKDLRDKMKKSDKNKSATKSENHATGRDMARERGDHEDRD